MKQNNIILLLSALVSLNSALSAGVVYTLSSKDLQKAENSGDMTVSVDGKNLKMEFADGAKGNGSMVFLGNENSVMMIDHERKQFFLMDEATLNQLGNQMSQAMVQMNEALKNVPPEQRAMMENMMKQRMGSMMPQAQEKVPTSIEKGDKSKTIAGYKTTHYLQKKGGQLENEFWVSAWKDIEGGDEAVEAFESMSDFMEKMMSSLSQGGNNPMMASIDKNMFKQLKELGGFPVSSINYQNGKPSEEFTLKSAETRDLNKSTFAAPKGYKKQRMDGK
jgi:hypothetical protein